MRVSSQRSALAALKSPGKHPTDLAGLCLLVSKTGKARWVLRYFPEPGKPKEVTLGALDTLDYSTADSRAADIKAGVVEAQPAMLKKRAPLPSPSPTAGGRTFREAAEEFITSARPRWRNPKSEAQWRASLETYAYPVLGDLDVRDIDTVAIVRAIGDIWVSKAETANRVRGRIQSILLSEAALKNRSADDPATKRTIELATRNRHVKGSRDGALSIQAKRQGRRGPMAAMSLPDLYEFVAHLWSKPGMSQRALLFTIHTCAREGSVRKADWSEIDFDAKVWRIPGDHMKGGKPFAIPLTRQALQILETLGPNRKGLIFPTPRKAAPRRKGQAAQPPKFLGLSDAAMDQVIERWLADNPGKPHATVHGFRTTCATALAASGQFELTLVDRVLAHVVGSKMFRAYIEGENVELRRPAMEYWSSLIEAGWAEVVLR